MISWGIDPGTSTSPTAISFWNNGKLIGTDSLKSDPKASLRKRIWHICHAIEYCLVPEYDPIFVCIEESVYLGKANTSLQKLLGALEYAIPKDATVYTVNPATLKKYYGKGNLDKLGVATAVKCKLSTFQECSMIQKCIDNEEWDVTDSIAIGYYGWMLHKGIINPVKKR